MVKTKEELRKSQYDNPEVKRKWREANLKRYKENPNLKYEITKKANEEVRKRSLIKFKTNPTKFISKRGYWMIYIPGKGINYMHRYIFCQYHNMDKIPEGFVIHHINFNRLDNRIENLQLMEKYKHNSLHTKISNEQNKERFRQYAKQRNRDKFGRFIKL